MARVFLETERLVLREFTEMDVDDLVALDSDPAVMRFLTGGEPTPRAEIEATLHRPGRWAAIEKRSGRFLGWFALTPGEKGSELGYRLRSGAWGEGYATEGSIALVDKGFTELGVQRVYAETMAVNLASRRVMEKTGLRFVRVFHLDWDDPIEGTEHGEVEYELLKADWVVKVP